MATRVEMERFDGVGDFGIWRQRMRAMLVQMKVSKALLKPEDLPPQMSEGEKSDLEELAYSTLILYLGNKVLREVANETTARGVWSRLEHLYMTKSLNNRVYLKGKLFGLKMQEGSSLIEFLDEFNKVIIDLANIGIKIEEEDQAILILNALPSSFSNFVETMKYSKDSLVLDHVLVALKSKHFDDSKISSFGEGLYVQGTRGKGGLKKGFDKSKIECYYCHKLGHFLKECPELDKKRKRGKREPNAQLEGPKDGQGAGEGNGQAALVIQEDEGYASADLLVAETSSMAKCDEWILDSGCSYHMCPYLASFSNVQMGKFGSIKLGSHEVCEVAGIGSISMRAADGSRCVLNDVRYVPDLRCNLISIGMLDSEGCMIQVKAGQMCVIKDSKVVLCGVKERGIYVLNGGPMSGSNVAAYHDFVCEDISVHNLNSEVADLGVSFGRVQSRTDLSVSEAFVSNNEPVNVEMRTRADGLASDVVLLTGRSLGLVLRRFSSALVG